MCLDSVSLGKILIANQNTVQDHQSLAVLLQTCLSFSVLRGLTMHILLGLFHCLLKKIPTNQDRSLQPAGHSDLFIQIMRSLSDFTIDNPNPIFTNATSLPPFFDHNLVQSTRVVKLFQNDVQANIRVFYYQYLKLCFEAEDCDYQQYIRKIEDIINDPNFSFLFDQADDPSVFNDMQFKQLIMEFFGLLGNGTDSIEACLNSIPIMDTVFVYFFRSILILTNTTESLHSYIDKTTLFNILVSHFNIEVNVHQNCIRFPQTDIFVYEEKPEEVYMAYLEGQPDNRELPVSREYVSYQNSEETIAPPMEIKQPTPQKAVAIKLKNSNANIEGVTEIKDSYISEEFVDYTYKGPALNTLVPPSKMKESTNIEKQSTNESKKNSNPNKQVKVEVAKIEESKKMEAPQYKTVKSDYQSEYSSKSQSNEVVNAQNTLLTKTDKIFDKPIEAKNDQFSYTNANSWQMSKDLTNGSKTTNIPAQQATNIYQANILPPQAEKTSKQANHFVPSFISSKATNNYVQPSNLTKQLLPKDEIYSKLQIKKPPSYQPNSQASIQIKKPGSYDPLSSPPLTTSSSSSKNPCGLNVSDEFTNSFTMKLMSQPSRSTVSHIRQRARNYRNSLKMFIQ